MKARCVCLIVCLIALAPTTRGAAARNGWSRDFDHTIEFQLLIDADLLVVGTARHLYGVDPRTGNERWRKRDLHVKPEDVLAVPETNMLLINDDYGGKFEDGETNILAVDRSSGNELWESKLVKGKGLQVVASPDEGLLVLVTIRKPHGDDKGLFASILPGKGLGAGFDRKPRINLLDLRTGRKLWDREFESDVQLRPSLDAELASGGGKRKERPFDLGLYQLPVIDNGQVFVMYRGLTCYDVQSGKKLWNRSYDVREGELALSDAEPIIDDRIVYTSGEGRIRAIDRATGKELWKSDDYGVVPELFIDDRAVYGRLGGRFFKILDEEWTWKGSYGAVAIDRRTGKKLWKYDSGNDSVTNLAIVADRVWLGDEEHLVGLDRATGSRVINERHKLSKRPVIVTYNENDEVVLISDQDVGGFNASTGKRAWYAKHEPIGPSGWRRFAAGLMMTTGAVLTVSSFAAAKVKGLLPAVPSPAVRISGLQPISLFNTRNLIIRTGSRAGKAFWRAGEGMLGVTRFAHLTGTHQYFITKLKGTDQALAGVNLTTGETDRAIELPSRAPNIAIDETNGYVTQAQGRKLVAVGL